MERSKIFLPFRIREGVFGKKKHPDPIVDIHPDTARANHIQELDWVWIESPRGESKKRIKITEGIDPGAVNVEHAWWFREDPAPE